MFKTTFNFRTAKFLIKSNPVIFPDLKLHQLKFHFFEFFSFLDKAIGSDLGEISTIFVEKYNHVRRSAKKFLDESIVRFEGKTSGGTCLEALFKVVLFEISTRSRTSSLMKCSFSLVCGQGSGFVGNLKIFVFKNSRKNLPEHPVDRKMLNPTSK